MPHIDLGNYDTDKSPQYLARYEREFGHLFDQPIKLLELGVQRGGSLYMWRDLLPNATIVGLDLNEIPIEDGSGRVHFYRGYQQDPKVLDRIAAEVAPEGFDIILDDASHIGRYTAESFWHLFPRHLKPGGIYVLDDWACGYWPEWADGHAYTGTREAVGDFSAAKTGPAPDQPTRAETLRRKVRGAARPIAAKMPGPTRARLEKLYMRAEGATLQKRFPSHDYGMVGVVKQLVDAVGLPDIDRDGRIFSNQIRSVHVNANQTFVHKEPSNN